MRLLLVEDDEALRTVTAQRLRREGYAADECGDGIEGMDYAINADYDGLVLDIMLPGMDGLSLLRALRARGLQRRRTASDGPGRGRRPGQRTGQRRR